MALRWRSLSLQSSVLCAGILASDLKLVLHVVMCLWCVFLRVCGYVFVRLCLGVSGVCSCACERTHVRFFKGESVSQ